MIRDYVESDLCAINALGRELKKDFDIEKRNEYERVLVYELDGLAIGFVVYSKLYEVLDLLYIVVDKDHRRRGIGRELLNALTRCGEERIILEVRSSNKRAIDFYIANGFKPIRTIKNYYDGVEDALSMERTIL